MDTAGYGRVPSWPNAATTRLRGYRSYLIGTDGQIRERKEFVAQDDEDALDRARQDVIACDIEVWTGTRKVGLVRAKA